MGGKIIARNLFFLLGLFALVCCPEQGRAADVRPISPAKKIQEPDQRLQPGILQPVPRIQSTIPTIESVEPNDPVLTPGGEPVPVIFAGNNLNLISSAQVVRDGQEIPSIKVWFVTFGADSRQLMLTADSEAPPGMYQVRLVAGDKSIDNPLSVSVQSPAGPESEAGSRIVRFAPVTGQTGYGTEKTAAGISPGTTAKGEKTPSMAADSLKAAEGLRMQRESTEGLSISKLEGGMRMETAQPGIKGELDKGAAYRYSDRFARELEAITSSAPRAAGGEPSSPDNEIPVIYRPKDISRFSVRLVTVHTMSGESNFTSQMIGILPMGPVKLEFPAQHSAQHNIDMVVDFEVSYPKVVVPGEVVKLYPRINYQTHGSSGPALKSSTRTDYDFGVLVETEEGNFSFNTGSTTLPGFPSGLLFGNKPVVPSPGEVSINQSEAQGVLFQINRRKVTAWNFPETDITNYVSYAMPAAGAVLAFYNLILKAEYTIAHDTSVTTRVAGYHYSFDGEPPGSNTLTVSSQSSPILLRIPDDRGLKAGDVLTMNLDRVEFEAASKLDAIVDGNARYYGEVCFIVCSETTSVDIPMNNNTVGSWSKSDRTTVPAEGSRTLRFEIVNSVGQYWD